MNNDDLKYNQVGNIRIKEPKAKKNKKKKSADTAPLGIKIFVWFMFFAMLLGALGAMAYYLVTYAMNN